MLIHILLMAAVWGMIQANAFMPVLIPVQLIEVPQAEEVKKREVAPVVPPPTPQAKPKKITAPKLLSKPEVIETSQLAPARSIKEEIKEPDNIVEPLPPLASLPSEPSSLKGVGNTGSKSGEAEGIVESVGSGKGTAVLRPEAKGDGVGGGGVGSGDAISSFTRPLSGYQVKPRYPESARRARAQGITVLKLRVLENGRVGEIQIEKSAGHRDLDIAAAEAVKKWVFEPAREGKAPVAVWVLVPVKFELQ